MFSISTSIKEESDNHCVIEAGWRQETRNVMTHPLIFLLIAHRINVLIDEVHRLAILIANVGVTRECR